MQRYLCSVACGAGQLSAVKPGRKPQKSRQCQRQLLRQLRRVSGNAWEQDVAKIQVISVIKTAADQVGGMAFSIYSNREICEFISAVISGLMIFAAAACHQYASPGIVEMTDALCPEPDISGPRFLIPVYIRHCDAAAGVILVDHRLRAMVYFPQVCVYRPASR